eukprot:CAMPEP_0182938254 /NCGR_PEP_ID=MMETSP0105_2-20130417/43554_1 /TAXON_ID=81532 ORGANISM="Acanthoeca-like sp., Strain 10tr" /NCGR_SAMPLE_ID=MMETSP0105_2 /ASSEMBLY_ACC=CAM_ASM_000205 /LENGTH=41 /DNA_ID= /DNA_START= /DNA_END= /DNA_ORIENTATION=
MTVRLECHSLYSCLRHWPDLITSRTDDRMTHIQGPSHDANE